MELTHESVLLTGATGYVGGRLLPLLESRGVRVRCLTRHPEALRPRVGAGTEIVAGDVSVYAPVGRALIEGVRNKTVVRDDRALENEDRDFAETRWCDTFAFQGGAVAKTYRTRVIDSRCLRVRSTAESAFLPIERIGGGNGWYFGDWLWWLRGMLDILVGGPGLRCGRRHPEQLRTGDTLDFWRVEACEPPRLLRLQAEMRLPGRAWLQFEVSDVGPGEVEIRQTAIFDPRGVLGRLYWYALVPLHALVFGGMLRGIARRAASLPGRIPARK